jgi:hypothetical protein
MQLLHTIQLFLLALCLSRWISYALWNVCLLWSNLTVFSVYVGVLAHAHTCMSSEMKYLTLKLARPYTELRLTRVTVTPEGSWVVLNGKAAVSHKYKVLKLRKRHKLSCQFQFLPPLASEQKVG